MIVADIMTRNVHTVKPDDTLGDLHNTFKNVDYRHLLVAENNTLLGVVSDRDVIARISPFLGTDNEREEDRSTLNQRVDSFMSTEAVTVDAQTIIDCASILLIENNISCLPVVDCENTIQGIVSWKDLLQYSVYGADEPSKDEPSC